MMTPPHPQIYYTHTHTHLALLSWPAHMLWDVWGSFSGDFCSGWVLFLFPSRRVIREWEPLPCEWAVVCSFCLTVGFTVLILMTAAEKDVGKGIGIVKTPQFLLLLKFTSYMCQYSRCGIIWRNLSPFVWSLTESLSRDRTINLWFKIPFL